MHKNLLTIFTLGLFLSFNSFAQNTTIGSVDMGEISNSEAFNQVKKLIGKWEGKLYQQSGAVVDTYSEFRLVSNGNSIVEKLVEDGVEMLTTYSDNKDGELVVKHYCALGTQPVFKASKVSSDMVAVSLDESQGGYHPEHHSYVSSMKWMVDADNKDLAVVGSTLYIDGELVEQQSVISRVN